VGGHQHPLLGGTVEIQSKEISTNQPEASEGKAIVQKKSIPRNKKGNWKMWRPKEFVKLPK